MCCIEISSATPATAAPGKGDALLTNVPGVLLAVQTADCVPIVLADKKRRAVAAIHSGWRGTLLRIAAKALGRMRMEFGTSPQDVIAAIGPSIGRCCYEVGSESRRPFTRSFPMRANGLTAHSRRSPPARTIRIGFRGLP